MAVLTPLSLTDAQSLLGDYDPRDAAGGAPVAEVVAVLAGTVNSSYAVWLGEGRRARCFVRIYEEQDREGAVAEAGRLERLAARGVRTPPPLRRRDGTVVGTMHGKPVVVFPWRDGDIRCLALVTARDAFRVGVALAEVHVAGRDIPMTPGRFEPSDLLVRLDRLAAVPFPAIAAQAAPLRSKLQAWCDRRDPSLPLGFVHGDVFRDNVLWEGDEISALLDFESASLGVFAYDLMVTVLAWSFRDALVEGVARAIVAGYQTVRPLTAAERAGLLAEGCIAALRFTVTRLTDAELRAAEAGVAPRRDKDYRRFAMRLSTLEALGPDGLARVLGLA